MYHHMQVASLVLTIYFTTSFVLLQVVFALGLIINKIYSYLNTYLLSIITILTACCIFLSILRTEYKVRIYVNQ